MNFTPTTPVSSEAAATNDTTPPAVAPEAEVLKRTVGAVPSLVTVTPRLDVVMCPAPSRAIAVSVWGPLDPAAVSHNASYGADVSSAPTGTPSTGNCTPATPRASTAVAG